MIWFVPSLFPPRSLPPLLPLISVGDSTPNRQGVEQQKLWLKCDEADLPMDQIFDIVKNQLASDAKSGDEPPEE